jgi:RNA polymerase sigma factor (sigma-70 family)
MKQHQDKERVIEELIDRHGTEIKRLAYLYVKDVSLAEDILQEVFISCYKNLDKFNGKSTYKTWLIRITINKSKDVLRKWSFRNLIFKPTIHIYTEESPEIKVLENYQNRVLIKNVMDLPIKFREVILLYYYEELSLEEISEITGSKINTIKTRLHRARKSLNVIIQEGELKWNES